MAQIQDKIHNTKPQSPSCFLGCFGFSEKTSLGKSGSGSRKKTRSFSWSRFRMKKSGTKTVPVDVTVSEKANQNIKNPTSKSKSKSGKVPSRRQIPDTSHNPPGQIPAVVADKSIIERPQKTRYGPEQSSILENRKHPNHLDSSNDNTCPKRLSFNRKIESIKTGLSHPSSPETKPKSKTASSSARNRDKRTANTSRIHRENDVDVVGKFDPLIGMSIIVVTLIIMLFWGRLCAILCTSAWFYFIPRLRASIESGDIIKNGPNSDDADMSSEEYKKRVVLEGFLERNHRSSFGIL